MRFARGTRRRHTPGTMNGLERAHAATLTTRKAAGEIAAYWFEAWTFKLGDDCRYTPDFVVMLADGTLEAHECKGFMEDDSLVKMKWFARDFPMVLRLFTKRAKKDGGGLAERVMGGAD